MPHVSSTLGSTVLREIVEAALEIPVLATAEGRDGVLAIMRSELTSSIPRLSTARMDTISIFWNCARYGALGDLIEAIRRCDGGSIAMAHLDAVLARHATSRTQAHVDGTPDGVMQQLGIER